MIFLIETINIFFPGCNDHFKPFYLGSSVDPLFHCPQAPSSRDGLFKRDSLDSIFKGPYDWQGYYQSLALTSCLSNHSLNYQGYG